MKTIKILWLYDDLLDLYGDSGNITIMEYYLRKNDFFYQIDKKSINDQLSFVDYQLVYIGPGKFKNLIVASKHFNQYQTEIQKAINDKVIFLVIGNARLLFGKSFSDKQETYPGIGLFDYQAVDTQEVYISDVIVQPMIDLDQTYYGFINRTGYLQSYDNKFPLFKVKSSLGDGLKPTEYEGNHYQNYFGTWLLGPLLVKNPDFLIKLLTLLTDQKLTLDNALEIKAHDLTMKEFK